MPTYEPYEWLPSCYKSLAEVMRGELGFDFHLDAAADTVYGYNRRAGHWEQWRVAQDGNIEGRYVRNDTARFRTKYPRVAFT